MVFVLYPYSLLYCIPVNHGHVPDTLPPPPSPSCLKLPRTHLLPHQRSSSYAHIRRTVTLWQWERIVSTCHHCHQCHHHHHRHKSRHKSTQSSSRRPETASKQRAHPHPASKQRAHLLPASKQRSHPQHWWRIEERRAGWKRRASLAIISGPFSKTKPQKQHTTRQRIVHHHRRGRATRQRALHLHEGRARPQEKTDGRLATMGIAATRRVLSHATLP